MDFELDEEFKKGAVPDVSNVGAFKTALESFRSCKNKVLQEKHQELVNRVALANFEQLSAELREDQAAADEYMLKDTQWKQLQESETQAYCHARYDRGLRRCEEYAQERLQVSLVDDLKSGPQEFAALRSRLLSSRTTTSMEIYAVIVLDVTVYHNADWFEGSLSCMANLLHQDKNNVGLVLMPQMHKCTSPEVILKHSRLVDDRLMAHNLCVAFGELAVTYHIQDEHGADRRRLSQPARLVTSRVFASTPWSESRVARGVIGPVPMMRVRDMVPPGSQPADWDRRITPTQRITQRGPDGVKVMLDQILEGMSLNRGDRVVVIDAMPGFFAEWAHAAWAVQKARSDDVGVAYLGLHVDLHEWKAVHGRMMAMLMEQWWENQSEAGPKERVAVAAPQTMPAFKAGECCVSCVFKCENPEP